MIWTLPDWSSPGRGAVLFDPVFPVQQSATIWKHTAFMLPSVVELVARVNQTCADPNPPICLAVWPLESEISFWVTLLHAWLASEQEKNALGWLHCGAWANVPVASATSAPRARMSCMMISLFGGG